MHFYSIIFSNSKNKDYKYTNILDWEILRDWDTQESGHG